MKQTIDRESVRVLAIELGAREAARRLKLNENTVLGWARKDNWQLPKRNGAFKATLAKSVKLKERPGDVLLASHKELGEQTKSSLARAAAKSAAEAAINEPLPVRSTGHLRDLANAAASIFGWDAGKSQTMTFNTMVVDPETLQRIRELREA
jgi:hypothetical protein